MYRQPTTVIFVHGWWGGPWVWSKFQPHFDSAAGATLAVDLRDSGSSFYDKLSKLRRISRQFEKPVFVAHSAGCLLVQKLMEEGNVGAAVMLGPAAPRWILPVRSRKLAFAAASYAPSIALGKSFLPTAVDMCALNLNRLSQHEQNSVYAQMAPVCAKEVFEVAVAGVNVRPAPDVPMLVVNGTDDLLTPPAMAQAISKKYGAEYKEYSEAAHYLMRENQHAEIARYVNNWLTEHGVMPSPKLSAEQVEHFVA